MIHEDNALFQALRNTASAMCLAAETAPKACGADSICTAVLEAAEIGQLCQKMLEIAEREEGRRAMFLRDAALLKTCKVIVLIGSKRKCRSLSCGYCGFSSCAEAVKSGAHCAYDDIDLGIAIGSAASVAADHRADNRVLFSAGYAAMQMKIFEDDIHSIIAIPLTVDPRNRFFIRT